MEEQLKEQLKEALMPLYEGLITQVNDRVKKVEGEERTYFCGRWGQQFPMEPYTGIMFVGRAVNGGRTISDKVDTLFNGKDDERAFDTPNQVEWVEDNRKLLAVSAFWRVIRGVSQRFYGNKNWATHVAWSNVCKVAPATNGNPNKELYDAQIDCCQEILKTEIEKLSPRVVVLFIGKFGNNLLRFLNGGNPTKSMKEYNQPWDRYECKVYEINGITYILTEHPQGKKEQAHIDAICKIIEQLSQ